MKEVVVVAHVIYAVDGDPRLRDAVMRTGWDALQRKHPMATNRHFRREVLPGETLIEYQFYGQTSG